jgi:hypothetical protein
VKTGPHHPFLCGERGYSAEDEEPDVEPLPEPEVGGAPAPDGGVPDSEPDPLPMSGQFLVEPEPELPLDPEVPLLELDEGVVPALPEVELVPELPVAVDVVAASATSAPPARSPDVSALTASTLRTRICMIVPPFRVFGAPAPCEPVVQRLRRGAVRNSRATCTGAPSHATN